MHFFSVKSCFFQGEGSVKIALRYGAYVNMEYDGGGNAWTPLALALALAASNLDLALKFLKLGANIDFRL